MFMFSTFINVNAMFIFIILLFLGQQIGGSLDEIKPSKRLLQYNKLLHLKSFRRSSLTSQPLETVYVMVYYESLCEDSRDFFTTQLTAAYELFEEYLDVRLIPYGKATTKVVDSPEYYAFSCQHGPLECYGNKLHACALNIFPSEKNAHVFNACLMDYDHSGRGSDDTAADKCGRALALNVKAIKQCASNNTGTFLHNYYGQRTRMTKFSYVPHILINGVRSNGTNLIGDICAILKTPPTECKIFKP